MSLTEEQRAAVEREGQDVCVVAGPGSGKTRVLVERFRWLVAERAVDPLRILAITFTEKAANEIKVRLVRQFATDTALRQRIEHAWISTIDGFCARILREHALAAAVDPRFEILEERFGDAGVRKAAVDALDRLWSEKPAAMSRLLDGWRSDDPAGALLDAYNTLRASDIAIDDLLRDPPRSGPPYFAEIAEVLREAMCQPVRTASQRSRLLELKDLHQSATALRDLPLGTGHFNFLTALRALKKSEPVRRLKDILLPAEQARLISEYYTAERSLLARAIGLLDQLHAERKRAEGVLDFADLEHFAVRLLERRPDVRDQLRSSFDAVLMDELQDTNRLQGRLIELIRRPGRFFAVGDINQSIFGFRHADPEVFTEYRDAVAKGAAVDRLTANFRSRPEILEAVTNVLASSPGIEPFSLISARSFSLSEDRAVEVLHADSDEIEASLIASRILEMKESVGFSRVAILVRSTSSLDILLPALNAVGIPYLLTKGRNFYETRQSRDLLALLKSIADAADELSLTTVLRSPFVGLDDEDLLRLKLTGNRDHARLRRFDEWCVPLRAVRDQIAPDRLLASAIDACGYLDGLDWRQRGNIEKFLELVRQLWAARPRPLAELVAELDMLRRTQPEPEAAPAVRPDAVQVMTVHGAKGLEFPVVFLPFLHRAVDRSSAALYVSPRHGLGARWRDPVTGEAAGDSAWSAARDEEKQREQAESNRLLYVAMTRAEERLVLSYSRVAQWASTVDAALANGRAHLPSAVPDRAVSPAAADEDQPIALERPSLGAQHNSAAAVTDVALFAACPRRYFLERYAGLPGAATQPVTGESGGVELGIQVHALLAGIDDSPADEVRELASRFVASPLGARVARASRVEREFDFIFAVDGLVLRGYIDLWFEEAGELILVDYKTDRDQSDSYHHQVRLYALALERILGRMPDQAVLFYLRTGKSVQVSLDSASIESTRRLVREFCDAQSRLSFPLNEGKHCLHCPYYWGACPAGLMSVG